ncbi:hypothetical protein TVAG_292560 [Trichomonas vaginalis G3]|uniref:Uncharacterized protein n=1 Tax=Trichomonas vaginalis (strain ATCC PRA-98 / G3) TaxID=412133 RepID=A2F0C8_TRIV3|nr:hypothetical protein TVAGG3_0216420 [Trichomonas vaginalis G3]EAY01623.1 hypothetical protein TVAG_292560 [Trichomonas vaginalis G3]KAI5551588.1 hypothetical protein TVAGG3_0216420 [Trichomonas vaginalis G3]|eukprot:XP_001330355.1 hypothetical protein [Trichomonas vaginalis G3]
MEESDPLQERVNYLRKLVNNLVIQSLALGHIPKIKPGIPMSADNLIKLRQQLEQLVSQEDTEKDRAEVKKINKQPKVHRIQPPPV